MIRIRLALALAGGVAFPAISSAQFADHIISYAPGTGFAPGYTNASAALRAPASGSSVTPFALPFKKSEIDGLSEVRGQFPSLAEDFAESPFQNGWKIFGNTNLFAWDSTNENLSVTWDSSQVNSYFYRPLGNILANDDNFSVQFVRYKPAAGQGVLSSARQPAVKRAKLRT